MLQRLDFWLFVAKHRLREFWTDEDGGVSIVTMVVLIGIAVLLASVFRDQITKLIKSLLDTITKNATKAVNGE